MKYIFITALLIASSFTFAQKKNTTNAAMAYGSYTKAMQSGDVELAAKDLLEAKGYVDLAIDHEDTKNDPKTLLYKGKIYLEIGPFGEMAKNETIMAMDMEEMSEQGVNALG